MRKTWLSLHYLVGYLTMGGVAFLAAPQMAAMLFQSNGTYSDMMLRLLGLMFLGLAVVVGQIIRLRNTALYPTTLLVRMVMLTGFFVFYVVYADLMLLVLLGIVGLGFVPTLSGYLLDRKEAKASSGG